MADGTSTTLPDVNVTAPRPAFSLDDAIRSTLKQGQQKADTASAEVRAATEKAEKKVEEYGNVTQNFPPPPPPAIEPFQPPKPQGPGAGPLGEFLGAMALPLAIFGGALTHQPLVNAMNAGAMVNDAWTRKNSDDFNAAFAQWQAHTNYAIKLHEYQHQFYKDELDRAKEGKADALDELEVKLKATHDEAALQAYYTMGPQGVFNLMKYREKLAEKQPKIMADAQRFKASFEAGQAYIASLGHQPGTVGTPEQRAAEMAEYQRITNPPKTGGSGKDQPFTLVDKDHQTVGEPFMAHRAPDGGYVSAETNEPIDIGPDQHIMPFKQDTARLQQQQQRMIGAANTSEFYLHNISRLPITASRGWFMGVETHTPEGLTDAFKRNFARNLTDYDTKEMQSSAAGLGRVFGMLETQGGLQGMQTYGAMIEGALTPQVNDPPLLTMRRMAEMRGIIERAAEAGMAQTKDPKVIALLGKIAGEARNSVPYTMDDVTDLEDGIRKEGESPESVVASGSADESIREFSTKVLRNLHHMDQALPADLPPPAGHVEGSTAKDDKGNVVAKIVNGQWAAP